ncbi:site-specific integrase [Photobacterium sp. 53610]|uniref:site-specific integrase n=1 Tax=Photobacterium sp. 53610 TaxID=3102789 RepID=UPI002EDB884A
MPIKKKITAISIKQLTLEERRLNDTEISGFHALMSKAGKVTYYLYYRIDGKQVNYKLGLASEITPAQARDLAREKAGEVAKGNDVQEIKKAAREENQRRRHLKLSTYLAERYEPFLTTRNPKTSRKIINHLTNSFKFLLDKDLEQITAWEIEKWRTSQRKLGRAPATINYTLNTLKGAISRAVDWGLIESHDLRRVKAIKADNTRVRYLTEVEEKRLRHALKERDWKLRESRRSNNQHKIIRGYDTLPSLDDVAFADYAEPLVILAMNTGLRRGELLGLEWTDVSFDERFLKVKASNAKSKLSRTMPLNNEAFEVLKKWRDQNPTTRFLFEGREAGKAITDVKKTWGTVLEIAMIEGFNFHDLRHHFASKLVMAGVDLNTVRELLGHADLKMTLRYAHLAPEHKAAAVSLIC